MRERRAAMISGSAGPRLGVMPRPELIDWRFPLFRRRRCGRTVARAKLSSGQESLHALVPRQDPTAYSSESGAPVERFRQGPGNGAATPLAQPAAHDPRRPCTKLMEMIHAMREVIPHLLRTRRIAAVMVAAFALAAAPARAFDAGPHTDMTRDALAVEGFGSNAANVGVVENWFVDYYWNAKENPFSGPRRHAHRDARQRGSDDHRVSGPSCRRRHEPHALRLLTARVPRPFEPPRRRRGVAAADASHAQRARAGEGVARSADGHGGRRHEPARRPGLLRPHQLGGDGGRAGVTGRPGVEPGVRQLPDVLRHPQERAGLQGGVLGGQGRLASARQMADRQQRLARARHEQGLAATSAVREGVRHRVFRVASVDPCRTRVAERRRSVGSRAAARGAVGPKGRLTCVA